MCALSAAVDRKASWLRSETEARKRTSTYDELMRFDAACEPVMFEDYLHIQKLHAKMTRVLVWDARHNDWLGVGDSASRLMSLLRVGRDVLNRATFIWQDACADLDGPPRNATPRRIQKAPNHECTFDFGRYFNTLGNIDYRWNHAKRRSLEKQFATESYVYRCIHPHPTCHLMHTVNASVVAHEEGAALSYIASRDANVIRIELTSVNDFRDAARASHTSCDLFMNARPKLVLWKELNRHLQVLDQTPNRHALYVRTGFADHYSFFTTTQRPAEFDFKKLKSLFRACPPSARTVSRVRENGSSPCVDYRETAASPVFVPASPGEELTSYVKEAERGCNVTNQKSAVIVVTDSPAVRGFVDAAVNSTLVDTVHACTLSGHVQYDNTIDLGLQTSAEWYVAGLANHVTVLSDGFFRATSRQRSFVGEMCASHMRFGWPHFFYAGNERESASHEDLEVMKILGLSVFE